MVRPGTRSRYCVAVNPSPASSGSSQGQVKAQRETYMVKPMLTWPLASSWRKSDTGYLCQYTCAQRRPRPRPRPVAGAQSVPMDGEQQQCHTPRNSRPAKPVGDARTDVSALRRTNHTRPSVGGLDASLVHVQLTLLCAVPTSPAVVVKFMSSRTPTEIDMVNIP